MTFEQWLQSDGLKLFRGYTYKGEFETGLKEAIEAVWNAAYEECLNDNAEAGKIAFNTAYKAGYEQGYKDCAQDYQDDIEAKRYTLEDQS